MKQARVGVSIILINKNKEVLIGKRKGSHGEGMWAVPGGKLDPGESYKECCDRELMEEVGVKFRDYRKEGFSEDFFSKNGEIDQFTTLYFSVRDIDPDIEIQNLEPEKCEGWEWVPIKEISKNLFCDTYNQINKILC